ncbi:MAG: hypothetical protein JO272_12915 [Pseudonocardiales bacterium]|nr:hypothetical protein [Pseudonocardiales bacterium]
MTVMQRLGQTFRRIIAHLTRSKARVGWILIFLCGTLYAFVDQEAVRQMALVLASVSAGAIFLPELSSDLWTMRADEIRKTVPEKRVAELQKELLVAATNSPDWSPFVWSEALSPMLSAVREPLQVQWYLTYDIRVYLDQVVEFAGERLTIHRLDSLCRSERLLPVGSNSRIWVSLARTHDALMNEFGSSGCLLREQVELPDVPVEKWRDAILQLCYVSVTINGQAVPLEVSVVDNLDVVRWETNISDDGFGGERVPVTVSVSFPLSQNVTKFPIIFASYYCVGRTEISFSVYHPTDIVDVEFVDFCSRRAGNLNRTT